MGIDKNKLMGYFGQNVNTTIDEKSNMELWNYDNENQKLDIDFKKSYLKTRKIVGFFTFLLVWVWLFLMIYVVLSQGTEFLIFEGTPFKLSETVIITLISTTTVNVVAFLTIVIRNLFPSKK